VAGAVALELGGLEVVAAPGPILHRRDLAAAHAIAQFVGRTVEKPGRPRRAPQPFGDDGQRDDGGGELLGTKSPLKQPLQLRQLVAR
jgi:hypothetical protein